MEEKTYLTLEEVQSLFSTKNEEYEGNPQISQMVDPLNKSFFKIIEHVQSNKVKVFQRKHENVIHTFVEVAESQLKPEEKEELVKVSNFLMKVEESLGYKRLQ